MQENERPATSRERAELARIGQRDHDRELWKARQNEKRARKAVWGYSTGGNHGGKRVRRNSK